MGRRTPLVALVALLLLPLPAAPAGSTPGSGPAVRWAQVQPQGGAVVAVADLDGVAGDEMVVSARRGGVLALRTDGSVLWHHRTAYPVHVALVPSRGGADVVVAAGERAQRGELAVLDGGDGGVVARRAVHSPAPGPQVADLDGDGDAEVVTASVDDDVVVLAFDLPHLTPLWQAALPEEMNAWYADAQSLATGDTDGDGAEEVVFATRTVGNAGGAVHVLDGGTGGERFSADTGPAFAAAAASGRVVVYRWVSAPGTGWQGEVVAFTGNGAAAWTTRLLGYSRSAPLAIGDLGGDGQRELVVVAGNHQQGSAAFGLDPSSQVVHALSLEDGSVRWRHKAERDITSLALLDTDAGADVVYGTGAFLSSFRDEAVVRVDGVTGASLWSHDHAAAFGDDDVAGIAAGDVDADGAAEVVFGHGAVAASVLDRDSGDLLQRHQLPSVWTAAAAGDVDADGVTDVAGGGLDGLVSLRSVEGELRWQAPVGGVVAGVAVDAGVLAVTVGGAGTVTALAGDGATRWSVPHGITPNPYSAHQVAFADLTGDDRLDVLVGGNEQLRPAVAAFDGATGRELWRASLLLGTSAAVPAPAGHVVGLGVVRDSVVAALLPASNAAEPVKVVALDPAGGAVRWAVPLSGVSGADAQIVPVGTGHVLVAYAGRRVSSLRLSDGALAATVDLGASHTLLPAGERVFAVATSQLAPADVTVLDADGAEVTITAPDLPAAAAAARVGDTLVHAATDAVRLLDVPALLSGSVSERGRLHLPTVATAGGQSIQVPTVRQVVSADGVAVGLSDLQVLNGVGGIAPGVFVVSGVP